MAGGNGYGEWIGTWTLASGNSVDAYLRRLGQGANKVDCRWDRFPLSRRERREYERKVVPELNEALQQALGIEGKALWVLT